MVKGAGVYVSEGLAGVASVFFGSVGLAGVASDFFVACLARPGLLSVYCLVGDAGYYGVTSDF